MKLETLDSVFDECEDYASWRYKSHGEWLDNREKCPYLGTTTIGSSDSPIIFHESSFKDDLTLWREKHGDIPREFKGNADTERGQRAEPLIRELWAVEHPEYDVVDGTGVVFYSKRYPWMSSSLDAIIRNRENGEVGILEIKHCRYNRKWKDGAPKMYVRQVVHQLLTTGWSFAILHARLICGSFVMEREYLIQPNMMPFEFAETIRGEEKFMKSLELGIPPKYTIPLK